MPHEVLSSRTLRWTLAVCILAATVTAGSTGARAGVSGKTYFTVVLASGGFGVPMCLEFRPDGVFIACTQVRALEVVDMLERDLGKPVYSAVQATAWQTFATLGIDPRITDRGSLLRRLSDTPASPATTRLRSA